MQAQRPSGCSRALGRLRSALVKRGQVLSIVVIDRHLAKHDVAGARLKGSPLISPAPPSVMQRRQLSQHKPLQEFCK